MAHQMSPLKLFLSLLLVWFTVRRSTESDLWSIVLATMAASAGLIKVGAAGGRHYGGGDGVGVGVTTNVNDCFETYLQQSRNASNTYATAYRDCHVFDVDKRLLYAEEQQPTREGVTKAVDEMCTAFRDCAERESDLAFFQCNRNNSYKNIYTLMNVYLNSSAAIVELEKKYQEAEKEMLLCFIAADKQYLNSTAKAYVQLSRCLKGG
ncbi:PREDICTED: uncharacterized protein LOC108355276 [Rhagoletis zephyria]|uniref:uncharacterized protein LOC108355276 n=1 Tax=Rhagoletis zephyria TaxID=28612 RepID=UPI00081188BD|nr:PREDICTED: uncharacterized protein LOC108355276 [Rhagoletis zephyria]